MVVSVTPCYSNAMNESSCDESSPLKNNSEKECIICLNPMEEGEAITTTKCNHKFHRGCWRKWVNNGPMNPLFKDLIPCPMCREWQTSKKCYICNQDLDQLNGIVYKFVHCGHLVHELCYNQLNELLERNNVMCRGCCLICKKGDCFVAIDTGDNVRHIGLSTEQLKRIAIRLYPELEDTLNRSIFSRLLSLCCGCC